jgi:hypothetical protein
VVHRYLTAPSAVGVLEVKRNGGKEVVTVENYYPSATSRMKFDEVQYLIKKRTVAGAAAHCGRKGKYHNILSNGKCGYCGGSFVWKNNKSSSGRIHHRLGCKNAKFGKGCERTSMNYTAIQDAILIHCSEINLSNFLENDKSQDLIKAEEKLQHVRSDLNAVEGKITNTFALMDSIKLEAMIKRTASELEKLGARQEGLLAEEKALMTEVVRLSRSATTACDHLQEILALREKLNHVDEQVQIETRRRLKFQLTQVVEEIIYFPIGLQSRVPVMQDGKIEFTEHDGLVSIIGNFQESGSVKSDYLKDNTGKKCCSFIIRFRNGYAHVFKWDHTAKRFVGTTVYTPEKIISKIGEKYIAMSKKSAFAALPLIVTW